MIERYRSKFIENLWGVKSTYLIWTRIERCVLLHLKENGHQVTEAEIKAFDRVIIGDNFVQAVANVEQHTNHDVAAFLIVLEQELAANGGSGKHLHYNRTSSDLVDTAIAYKCQLSAIYANQLLRTFKKLKSNIGNGLSHGIDFTEIPCVAYTHGQPAELFDFSHRLTRIQDLLTPISLLVKGHLNGPTGQQVGVGTAELVSQIAVDPVLSKGFNFDVSFCRVFTQNEPRNHHAKLVLDLALNASILEKFATDMRLLSIIGEIKKQPSQEEVGSSAMPHKANPIEFEKVCGLSRLLRSMVTPALENVPLWLERDISHSSVERITLEDAFHLYIHILETLIKAIPKWVPNYSVIGQHIHDNRDKLQSAGRLAELQVELGSWTKAHQKLKEELRK